MKLPLSFLFNTLIFFISRISSIYAFFFNSSSLQQFYSIPYAVYVFLGFFKGFINLIFKDLYHNCTVVLRSLCVCVCVCVCVFFSYVGIFRACYDRVAGFYHMRHIALAIIDLFYAGI